jgi:hypothetical protein
LVLPEKYQVAMHVLAWREKHTYCKALPTDDKRPVAGLSYQDGILKYKSSSYNEMVYIFLCWQFLYIFNAEILIVFDCRNSS